MKKIFSIIFVIALSQVHAQSGGPALLSEDFDNGIPGNWSPIDVDQQALFASMIPRGWTGQWQFYNHMSEKCAANCSRLLMNGNCNDYLISPGVVIPAGGAMLSWKAAAAFNSYLEDYDVMISTTAQTINGLMAHPSLMTITSAPETWTTYTVDLGAYAGQTVYIGFRHHSAGFALFIDEMRISTPVANDASLSSVDLNDVLSPGMYSISGKLTNEGNNTITSVDVDWTINNGPVNTYSILSTSLNPGAEQSFTHNIQANLNTPGTYTLRAWTDIPNSSADNYTSNDTLTKVIYVSTTPRRTLVEEYTQAGCVPCADANPHFDSLLYPLIQAHRVSSIKYHTNWPVTDPMYDFNPGGATSRVEYYGIGLEPAAVIDGAFIPNSTFPGDLASIDSSALIGASDIPAIYVMSSTSQLTGNVINVSVSVTAVTDIPVNSMRLFTAVVEDTIIYSTPPGVNGETDFYQVFRYMLPDSIGEPLPAMSANQTLVFNYSYSPDPVIAIPEIATVAFVQDDATRKVYQSTMDEENTLGVNSLYGELPYRLFPDPAVDFLLLELPVAAGSGISCQVYDLAGKEIVVPQTQLADSSVQFNISSLPKGYYLLRIISDEGETSMHFIKAN